MPDRMRFLLLFGIISIRTVALVHGQITTQPYQYNGGTFTVTTVFNFDTSIETDSMPGTTRFQPVLTITSPGTGRSITATYLSKNDYISGGEGNILIGKEVVPGRENPRTNMGIAIVDASSLGPGPLVFSAAYSELSSPLPTNIRNIFGGPYHVWRISPQSITPTLSPYIPPRTGVPPGGGPVVTSIHAVIISGRSDPAKIVTSQNVTLVGGVVALGKDSAPPTAPNPWSSGLRIVPDEALLTGTKIPPLTPNILDVRIVKHAVVGDLAVPSASP